MRRLLKLLSVTAFAVTPAFARPQPVDGIIGLANRLLDGAGDAFEFSLTAENENWSRWNQPLNDNYTVTKADGGRILVRGTSLSALARG